MAQVTVENIEIIRRFEHAFRAADQATIDELCDPGLIEPNPAPDEEPTLAGLPSPAQGELPRPEGGPAGHHRHGDTVATRGAMTALSSRSSWGSPPPAIRVEGMNFYRLRDGRVTDICRTHLDGVALLAARGAGPLPA